jgi:hypothetical protein
MRFQSAVRLLSSLSWRSRPLCPYPSHAHYHGTDDIEDSASFDYRYP